MEGAHEAGRLANVPRVEGFHAVQRGDDIRRRPERDRVEGLPIAKFEYLIDRFLWFSQTLNPAANSRCRAADNETALEDGGIIRPAASVALAPHDRSRCWYSPSPSPRDSKYIHLHSDSSIYIIRCCVDAETSSVANVQRREPSPRIRFCDWYRNKRVSSMILQPFLG